MGLRRGDVHRQLHRERVFVVAAHCHVRDAQDRPRFGLVPPVWPLSSALRGDSYRNYHIGMGLGLFRCSIGHCFVQVFLRASCSTVHP